MSEQWERYVWAQLTQGDQSQTHQHQYPVPDGYAPVHGYAPAQDYAPSEAQNGYSDHQEPSTGSYEAHQTQEDNTYTVSDNDDDDDTLEEGIREFVPSRRQQRKSKSQAMPKKEQPMSKRAERRAKVAIENHGEVSARDTPKGLVEYREGVLQWWDPTNKEWLKAAYHDQFRDQFIWEDSFLGSYVVAPERGKGANDITSACSAFNQLEWRLADRDTWGNIVDADGNKVLYLLDRPAMQSYEEPERLWWHNGCVLLDGDNNPVRPFPSIPRAFSSKIEGGRIEAYKRILPGLTIQDIRARCLRAVPTEADGITKPLSYPSTFGHRASRFRSKYQTPAWLPRAASAVLKKQVTDLLPEAEAATTTEGLQPLSRYEIARRKSATRGKYLYKATGRAITNEEREKRDRKLEQRLERQSNSQPSTPLRLQSVPTTPWQSASPSPYLPTPPFSIGNKRHLDDVGQSEPATKRGRLGASPRDPRLQGRFPTTQTSPEDDFQQAPTTYDPTSIFGTTDLHQGSSGSNATGHGLDFAGGTSVIPENLAPSEGTVVPESPPENTASTNASLNENNFQVDHRFVEPQNSREQMSVQTALFYPRTHYFSLIGEHPPETSDGTYSAQYLQILTLLEQKWNGPGNPPVLADVGPWYGPFGTVPTPDLPDQVLEMLLHPNSHKGIEQKRESHDWSDDLFGE